MATVTNVTFTPHTMAEIRAALIAEAKDWTPNEHAMFSALISIETEGGRKIACENVGNIAAGGFVNGKESLWTTATVWRPPWFEDTSHRLHQAMLDGKAPSAFRAYRDLADGVRAYVALIARKTRMRAAAKAGDPAAFVDALQVEYSPDYGPKHVASFESLTAGKLTRTASMVSPSSDGAGVAVVAVVAVVLLIAAIGGTLLLRKKR